MLNYEEKELLQSLARDIKEFYDFHLVKPFKNYKNPETIVKDMNGTLMYHENDLNIKICRNGPGFIISVPKRNYYYNNEILDFARALSILFLQLKYTINPDEFMKLENLEFQNEKRNLVESINFLTYEMIISKSELKEIIKKHLSKDNVFSVKGVAEELGLSVDLTIVRLKQCNLIQK